MKEPAAQQKSKRHGSVFIEQCRQPHKGDQLNKLLQQLKERAALQKVTLHHLRHSIATHLLQSGMGIEYVRDFLGHSQLETTQIYTKPKAEQLKLL